MESRKPRISAKDRARLLLNTPETANRFVWYRGKLWPILHLPIGRLERFRGATEEIEKFLQAGFANGFEETLAANKKFANEQMKTDLVSAAAIALNVTEEDVKTSGHGPMEVLTIVLEQWVHNSEAEVIKKIIPMPPDDKDQLDVPDDPSEDNPLSLIERMASGYHWDVEKSIQLTLPQVYLMGSSGAWSWYRSELKSKNNDNDVPAPRRHAVKLDKRVGDKTFKRFKDMTAAEYREYLNTVGI